MLFNGGSAYHGWGLQSLESEKQNAIHYQMRFAFKQYVLKKDLGRHF